MQKFNSVLDKFENYVNGVEQANFTDKQLERFESLVSRLEKLSAGGANVAAAASQVKAEVKQAAPAGGASSAPAAEKDLDVLFKSECFKNTADLIKKTKAMENAVLTDAVKAYLELFQQQLCVFECMCACAKPANFDALAALATSTKKVVFDLGKKDRKISTHLRTIEDATSLFCWFKLPAEKKEFLEDLSELAGGMDFQGQKLVYLTVKDKEWYRALRVVQQDFAQFLKGNFPRCLKWEGDMEDLESFLECSVNGIKSNPIVTMAGGGSAQITAQAPAPVKAAAPAKAAGTAAAKPKPAVKEPTKVKKGRAIEFSDYKNVKEVIELDEGEVDQGTTLNFFNCERITVKVSGKFKNFLFSRCKGIKFQFDEIISLGEIITSQDFKIFVQKKAPTIAIQKCNGVEVFTTLESKHQTNLSTTASQSISFEYPKDPGTFDPEDEDADDTIVHVIPETYNLCLKENKIIVEAADLRD